MVEKPVEKRAEKPLDNPVEKPFAAVILAAGQGTRMKSRLPKMLHEAAGRPLLEHVLAAVEPLLPERTVIVVGHGADQIRERFAGRGVTFVLQEEQLGTGHALQTALPALEGFDGDIMVLTGDSPLLTSETLDALRTEHQGSGAGMTLLVYRVGDPYGLGRIVRDERGNFRRIVEEKDATPEERQIDEISPGLFMFDSRVGQLVPQLSSDNAQGEYYITDLPALYLAEGMPIRTALGRDETGLLVGVNDRRQLAEAERILRDRIRRRWLLAGVTMHAPEFTFIDDSVELARDVTVEPGAILRGATTVGEGARIGAYSILEDAAIPPGESVAPYTHLVGSERS